MAKGFVVSDIHKFSRRSLIDLHEAKLEQAMNTAKVFVLNGDIFDFRWSVVGDARATATAAAQWLRQKLNQHSSCSFHYVLGNADSRDLFVTSLYELADQCPNLQVHEEFVVMAGKLFLHGDIIHAHGDLEAYRARFVEEKPRGALGNLGYDILVRSGLSRYYANSISRAESAKIIVEYLKRAGPEELALAKHIYFGHTHAPFTDFHFESWIFHNTGAMLRGLEFRMLEFET